jgi:hypothetical protein
MILCYSKSKSLEQQAPQVLENNMENLKMDKILSVFCFELEQVNYYSVFMTEPLDPARRTPALLSLD